MLWFEQRFVMVEMDGICQVLWIVMLECAKDRILGVDTLGQHVLTRVWYGTACLLIRDDVGSVPCSDEWEVAWSFAQAYMVQEGSWYRHYPRKP
jgi:hypothetical protein